MKDRNIWVKELLALHFFSRLIGSKSFSGCYSLRKKNYRGSCMGENFCILQKSTWKKNEGPQLILRIHRDLRTQFAYHLFPFSPSVATIYYSTHPQQQSAFAVSQQEWVLSSPSVHQHKQSFVQNIPSILAGISRRSSRYRCRPTTWKCRQGSRPRIVMTSSVP